jgi:hypothetical protein
MKNHKHYRTLLLGQGLSGITNMFALMQLVLGEDKWWAAIRVRPRRNVLNDERGVAHPAMQLKPVPGWPLPFREAVDVREITDTAPRDRKTSPTRDGEPSPA